MKYLIIPIVFFSSCHAQRPDNTTIDVSNVLITNTAPDPKSHEFVEEIDCERKFNLNSPKENILECRYEMKLRAKVLKSDVVVMITEKIGSGKCSSCVNLIGNVYKKRTADQTIEPKSKTDAQISIEARLKKLGELKEQGLISEEEYNSKRSAIIENL